MLTRLVGGGDEVGTMVVFVEGTMRMHSSSSFSGVVAWDGATLTGAIWTSTTLLGAGGGLLDEEDGA